MELVDRSWALHLDEWRGGRAFGPKGAARWCLDELGLAATAPDLDELAEAIATGTLAVGTAVVNGAAEALGALHRAGIPTALICDTGFTPSWVVREALCIHNLTLDHSFFSDEVGTPKPYPPMFLAALEATGAAPGEAVHIGDLRRTDVAGARAAGMAAVRFAGVHDDGGRRRPLPVGRPPGPARAVGPGRPPKVGADRAYTRDPLLTSVRPERGGRWRAAVPGSSASLPCGAR